MPGNDSFTKILLHMDGADASTTFTDSNSGGSAHTWTASGNAQIDTAQSKFGGASGAFDGSNDWIRTPDHADFTLGSGDFTCDFWIRFSSGGVFTGTQLICAQTNASATVASATLVLHKSSSHKIVFRVSNGTTLTTVTGTTTLSADTWYHVAAVRTGNTLKLFINGTQEGGDVAFSDSIPDSTASFGIGTWGDYTPNPLNLEFSVQGWIDEFRLSVGTARWTANFTPPTEAYSQGAIQDGSVSFAGSGVLSVNAFKPLVAAVTLAGAGNLSARVVQSRRAQATFAGASSFRIEAGGRALAIAATFAGAGALSATLRQGQRAAVRFAGASTARFTAGPADLVGALMAQSAVLTVTLEVSEAFIAILQASDATLDGTGSIVDSLTGTISAQSATLEDAIVGFFKDGQFNWTGEGILEFMPTVDFITDTLEDPEALLTYAAEIHVRSL